MTRRVVTTVVDCAAFFAGYAVVSRRLTGGGVVDVRIITRGDEPTFTVIASLVAGLGAVLVWRAGRWAAGRLRRR